LKRWFVGPDAFCPHSTAISRGFSQILNDLHLAKIDSNERRAQTRAQVLFPLTAAVEHKRATCGGGNRAFTIR
jgi:hypothetical protein